MFATFLRLIKALVLWTVLAFVLIVLLSLLSRLSGWFCGIEWIAVAVLFIMHLISIAAGPLLWQKGRNKQDN